MGIAKRNVKNVLVLGGSYGGMRASTELAKKLPPTHRVVLVDRNTHFNHLYAFPRFSIYPGHEHKAFIPYTTLFSEAAARKSTAVAPGIGALHRAGERKSIVTRLCDLFRKKVSETEGDTMSNAEPHLVVCGQVSAITDECVTVQQHGDEPQAINIDYSHLVYALGNHLPDPLRRDGYSKLEGMEWMKRCSERIEKSENIVVIGGGALGVQFASDIATRFAHKRVTLVHSGKQLMPRFDQRVHDMAYERIKKLGINLVLGHRVASVKQSHKDEAPTTHAENKEDARYLVCTNQGLELDCDMLLLCTGTRPNSALMADFSPSSVDPQTRQIRVLQTLQVMRSVGHDDTDHFANIFAIGDVAETAALHAGYQAYYMGEVAAENILRQIIGVRSTAEPDSKVKEGETIPMQDFAPLPPMLKLTVGGGEVITQDAPAADPTHPDKMVRPIICTAPDTESMDVESVWKSLAHANPSNMHA